MDINAYLAGAACKAPQLIAIFRGSIKQHSGAMDAVHGFHGWRAGGPGQQGKLPCMSETSPSKWKVMHVQFERCNSLAFEECPMLTSFAACLQGVQGRPARAERGGEWYCVSDLICTATC